MKKLVCVLMLAFLMLHGSFASAEALELIGRDELLDLYDLGQAEDYVDSFIVDCEITRAFAENVDVTPLYRLYVSNKEAEKHDFMYLLSEPETVHTNTLDADQIHRVLWLRNPAPQVKTCLFDLQERVLYYGEHNILNNISLASTRELSESDCQAVLDILNDQAVTSWNNFYPSTINDTTGWLFWQLSIEYLDGSIFQSSGSGSTADNLPQTYSQVNESLWQMTETR